MFRRLSSLLLMLACAFAPVAPALAAFMAEPDACCCAAKCPCAPMSDCAPAPSAPQRSAPNVGAAVEQTATTAKPAPRVSRLIFAHAPTLVDAWRSPALSVSAPRAVEVPAAGVALFHAHCSWRI